MTISFNPCKTIAGMNENNIKDADTAFTDSRDGRMYKTLKIGNQTWMKENLAYKADSGCWAYDNKQENVAIYGYLYNWETAKKACPAGWHLPSDEEWKKLEIAIGMKQEEADKNGWRGTVEGGKLKQTETTYWTSPNKGATNSSGFSAIPGGCRVGNGAFYNIHNHCGWWSATENDAATAWSRFISFDNIAVNRSQSKKETSFTIRCLKD